MGALVINRLSPLTVLGTMFVAYAAASISWSAGDKALAGATLAAWVLCFAGGRVIDAKPIWFACMALTGPMIFLWDWFELNPNYLAAAIAVTLASAIAYRVWLYLPLGIFGLIFCQSRGALLAAGVAMLIGLWCWSRFWALISVLAAILVIASQKPDGLISFTTRLGIWQDTINHYILWGHGLGSFQAFYTALPVHTNMIQIAPHAYNDYFELISDLGIGAIIPITFLIIAWEFPNPPAKLILLTFFVLSLTHFPLWIPIVGNLFAFTLGDLTSQRKSQWHDGN